MFKEATRQKLRFQTTKGVLSVEQLWDLSLDDLDKLAVSLDDQYKKSQGKSFLEKRSTKDATIKLQFDIALSILETKKLELETEQQASEDKKHNERIIQLIAEKKDEELKGKSVKELEKMLR